MRKAPVLTSLAIHVGAICLLLLLASIPRVSDAVKHLPDHIALFAPRPAAHQGGGGQRSQLPASRGQAPPKAMTRVFVPPMAVRLGNPKLQIQQAMLEAPEIQITAADIGDPLGKIGPLSGGPGGPNGIGTSIGIGIGNSPGPGQGGPKGPISYKAMGITQEPKVLHSIEPEYSEEARKARYQGTVVLGIDIDVTGHVSNIRVLRGLGLGLDEKAMAAVAQWLFRPAMAGGKVVAAPAQVSVTFHLL
jgi:periplasmic protein TonB